MTDEREDATEPQPEPPVGSPEPAPGSRRRGGGLAALALLVALAAVGGVAWLVWQERQAQTEPPPLGGELDALRDDLDAHMERQAGRLDELERRLAEAERRASNAADAADDVASRLESRATATQALQSDLEDLSDDLVALSSRVESLSASAGGSPGESKVPERFALAEAELMVRAAYARLAGEPDPASALALLQQADRQLATLDAAGTDRARQAIAAEMEALRAVEQPDRSGIAARLAALAERAGALPLALGLPAREATGKDTAPSREDGGWWRATGQFLGRYFTVRRTDESGTSVPDPATLSLVRQVLRMELEQARIAVLRGDAARYRDGLERASRLLSRHFDDSDNAVREFARSVEALSGAEIELALPTTGDALDAVSRLRARVAEDA